MILGRSSDDNRFDHRSIQRLSDHLQPDHIQYQDPYVSTCDGVISAVINPCESLLIDGANVCLGGFFGEHKDWVKVGSAPPDGSYALYRVAENSVELMTDRLASRCVWYALTDTHFFASSSQRAIVALLGDFKPDASNVPWMLTSGTLNFMRSWDERIFRMPLNSRLTIDRDSWSVDVTDIQQHESAQSRDTNQTMEIVTDAIQKTVRSISVDTEKWYYTLSGGYDSRSIVLALASTAGINTITWGAREQGSEAQSDADVARRLSQALNTRHTYKKIQSQIDDCRCAEVLDRFVKNSEGQVDNFSAYVDGFSVWKEIYESDYQGVIRGDEALADDENPLQWETAYIEWGLGTMQELPDFCDLSQTISEFPQSVDSRVRRIDGESMTNFCQRLCEIFYISMTAAPLNYMKTMYCEVLTPLLSRAVVDANSMVLENLKTNKIGFKKIIEAQLPEIGFATRAAIQSRSDVFGSPTLLNYVLRYVEDSRAKNIIPTAVIDELLGLISAKLSARSKFRVFGPLRALILRVKRKLNIQDMKVDPALLAFRLYIVIKAHEVFAEDSKLLNCSNDR